MLPDRERITSAWRLEFLIVKCNPLLIYSKVNSVAGKLIFKDYFMGRKFRQIVINAKLSGLSEAKCFLKDLGFNVGVYPFRATIILEFHLNIKTKN